MAKAAGSEAEEDIRNDLEMFSCKKILKTFLRMRKMISGDASDTMVG